MDIGLLEVGSKKTFQWSEQMKKNPFMDIGLREVGKTKFKRREQMKKIHLLLFISWLTYI